MHVHWRYYSYVHCPSSTVLRSKWHSMGWMYSRDLRVLHGYSLRNVRRLILISRSNASLRESVQPTMQLEEDAGSLPPVAWKRKLDTPPIALKEFRATIGEAFNMLGFIVRLWKYTKTERAQGRRAPIDPFKRQSMPSAYQGVPLGGIGSVSTFSIVDYDSDGGSIGRGLKGEFMRWQLAPGICEDSAVLANQFSVFTTRQSKSGETKKLSSVLYSGQPEGLSKDSKDGISSWNWKLNGQNSMYYGLFPRSWTTYEGEPDPDLKITCRQISPFIPHNYKESSFPACTFVYELANTGEEDANVTLLFTWANSVGGSSESSGGHHNVPFIEGDGVRGVLLHHRAGEQSLTFATAARETDDVSVSVCPCFVISGALDGKDYQTAKDMWMEIAERGCFDESNWTLSPSVAQPGSVMGSALAATVLIPAHGKKAVTFGLAWDSPEVKFLDGKSYFRRYTKFYGRSGNAASKLVHEAILNYQKWEADIVAWQAPILKDESLPEWYRHTLFNELYYLVAGGTVWTDDGPGSTSGEGIHHLESGEISEALLKTIKASKPSNGQIELSSWTFPLPSEEDNVGRFLYLEGVEYRFWNTYDVHFYASYALLQLFPKLELRLQRDIAAATLSYDPEEVQFLAHGEIGIRKVFGAVPHDVGTHNPWIKVYRDVVATGDMAFARAVWPAVYAAIAYMDQFDRDRDGMIENDGFPDQTYDLWTVKGVSAYCGGLWVAALQAASGMAEKVNDKNAARCFHAKFLQAKAVYEKSLWNGSYFNYDNDSSVSSVSIQADQLAGQWYSLASGLPPFIDGHKATSTLQKVFDFNVMQFNGGTMGAVNGMMPDGQVDRTSLQSREIWTGSTYAVAALMIHEGLRGQGFKTAEGIFRTGWSEQGQGYSFQTPEAWVGDGGFRALAYMRPLAIWAMQWALNPPKGLLKAPKVDETTSYSDEGFSRLAKELKDLSTRETKTYSSVWIYVYDYVRNRIRK